MVDPHTGLQIEHVAATDPDKGWIEVWATYACHPDHKSIWTESGVPVERNYMLLQFTGFNGRTTYQTKILHIDFDIINKHTGLVLHEVRQKRSEDEVEASEQAAPGDDCEGGDDPHLE